MKKRSTKKENSFKCLFNKMGMTYVELICALALLSLIVVMFTPMLLSSYETLYKAGEKVEEIYNSKVEIEEDLARRDSALSVVFNMNLKVSTGELFESINVNGRKAVSSLQQSFETVFGQIRPTIKLLSPSHVNDDTTEYEILIQTKGLEFSKISGGKKFPHTIDKSTGKSDLPKDEIFIEVIIPDKTKGGGSGATVEDAVYSGSAGYCSVLVLKNDTYIDPNDRTKFDTDINNDGIKDFLGFSDREDEGKIALKIGNDKLDFTYSPLKIQVYYVDTRGRTKTVSEYIYIDPPTIMMAGETNVADYYTSAGVQEHSKKTIGSDGNDVETKHYSLEALARKMRTDNSVHLKNAGAYSGAIGSPSALGSEIRSIRWIGNDETDGINPYYVMTGTNGAIYRMYNFTSDLTNLYNVVTGATVPTNSFFNSTQPVIDQSYDISSGHRVHASMWSGDYSHAFDFSSAQDKYSSYGKGANHGDKLEKCWNTSDSSGAKGDPAYNVFSPQAQYAYYFNGEAVNFGFKFKKSRPISYIITEKGYPLRLYGFVQNEDEYNGLHKVWDTNGYTITGRNNKNFHTWADQVYAFYYPELGDDNFDYSNDWVYSSINIKALASYDLTDIDLNPDNVNDVYNYLNRSSHKDDEREKPWAMRKIPVLFDKDYAAGETFEINVTDAIYIPKAGNVAGSTFYVGTIHAISNIVQLDKVNYNYVYSNNKDDVDDCQGRYYRNYRYLLSFNRVVFPSGAVTDFMIVGNDEGTGTYISKYHNLNAAKEKAKDGSMIGEDVRRAELAKIKDYVSGKSTMAASNSDQRNEFFAPQSSRTEGWNRIYLDDVKFTLGFASNREKVYTNITYDGDNDYNKSFEKYYWISHYGTDNRVPNKNYVSHNGEVGKNDTNPNYGGTKYLNSKENDYYNVWFPGEMYNLTKIASKDGVTVSVGYAVSGAAYQWMNQNTSSYGDCSSTALGGVYNDGVLAAMVEGQDTALHNLLYYKDNESMNKDYLSKNKANYSDFVDADTNTKQYGTHVRDSVQFTAVDIFVEEIPTTTEGVSELNYYAFYGDNKGRVYKSLIATGTGTIPKGYDPDDENSTLEIEKDIELVSFISDAQSNESDKSTDTDLTVPNMEEIYFQGGNTCDVAFSSISSIEVTDDLVIITGELSAAAKKNGWAETFVVGEYKGGVWKWKYFQNDPAFKGNITGTEIVGGYYYFVGEDNNGSFLGAIPLDLVRATSLGGNLTASKKEYTATSDKQVIWCYLHPSKNSESYVKDRINAIAGRAS